MTLRPEERNSIVSYRIDKAFATLKETKDIIGLGYWSLAANRLYYAAYYASVALLISRGIETTTHKGTIRMIGYNFVKDGILAREDGQLLGRLFSMRQTGDYEDQFDWAETDVAPLIPVVEAYVMKLQDLIKL